MSHSKNLERLESLKVGTTGAIAAALMGLLTEALRSGLTGQPWELGLSLPQLVPLAGWLISGFLFAATYRYVVRDDTNPHLKSGAILAFGLVRGLAGSEHELFPLSWRPGFYVGQSLLLFAIAALAVEWVMNLKPTLQGDLRGVHHIALNVKDMQASRHFYGQILGLHELTGDEIPVTLKDLVAAGKVCNFVTPDGTVLDLFWEPNLTPPDPNPEQQFTRCNHLAFDIAPSRFEQAYAGLQEQGVTIAEGPVTRPTGRGVYVYDPDGFMVEIRCDPA